MHRTFDSVKAQDRREGFGIRDSTVQRLAADWRVKSQYPSDGDYLQCLSEPPILQIPYVHRECECARRHMRLPSSRLRPQSSSAWVRTFPPLRYLPCELRNISPP